MALKLTLTAQSEPVGTLGEVDGTQDQVLTYPVDATKIVLKVSVDGAGELPKVQWQRAASNGEAAADVAGATSATHEFDPTADTDGWYTVKCDPEAEVSPPGINVAKAPAATPPAQPPAQPGVAEVAVGEYDGRFALGVGALTLILGVLVTARVFDGAGKVKSPTTIDAQGAAQVSGATLAWAMLGVGALLLLAGAAMAALETRGRLRRGNQPVVRSADATQLEALAKILTSASALRGSVATLVAGVLIVLSASYMGAKVGAPPSPTPTSTATATSTATGTGTGAATSPTTDGATATVTVTEPAPTTGG